MLERFQEYIRQRGLASSDDRILLAVSGGVDSMVMLDLFRNIYPSAQLAVGHCNFGLRGEESDADEALVRQTCERHGIRLHTVRFETSREAGDRGESIQMAARRLRYAWFDELCDTSGYDRVAIAHQADDSVETFFINLMRGTGLRGLTGISGSRGRIIRPLLFAGRDEITAYAAEHNIPFRNDSTNDSTYYLRNRLRHQIIPLFSSSSNDFTQTMEGNLSRLQQAQNYIDEQIARLREAALRENILDLGRLSPHSYAFELHELLTPYGFVPEVIEDLGRTVQAGRCGDTTVSGKQFLSPRWTATFDRGRVILTPTDKEPLREEWIAGNDSRIEWLSVEELPASLAAPGHIAYLAADALKFPLRLRRWQEGDWFIPLGMFGQKKVSDFLIDAKVPLTEKADQGVLLSGETIVWLVGRRIDDRYKVLPDSRKVIRITL